MSLRTITVVYFTKMRSAEQICLNNAFLFPLKHSITLTLLRFISALANNTAFDAYEPVFPVFPGAYEAHRRASETQKRASEIYKRACQQHAANILAIMNTFFPFFPALVRIISALLGLISALLRLINALLGIECADRYKLPPALFWRLQAHSYKS